MKVQANKFYVFGDVHGYFDILNEVMKKLPKEKSALFFCGDFCLWPEIADISDIEIPENFSLYVIPGNHENWDYLDTFGYTPTELKDRLFYMPFGSILNIEYKNKEKIALCAGGADSIDKGHRTAHYSWWPQEIITEEDMRHLPDIDKVDIVFSHTIPNYFKVDSYKTGTFARIMNYHDISQDRLDEVLFRYKPERWFAGHFHYKENWEFISEEFSTKWMVLGESRNTLDWFVELTI